MKPSLMVLLALLVAGCKPNTGWTLKHVPTTEQERKAVAEQVAKILAATPRELSGHDQDWDAAIREATQSACESVCQPTMWEYREYVVLLTGRWRPVEAITNSPLQLPTSDFQ